MSDDWHSTKLGDCLVPVSRTVAVVDLDNVPFAGVRWYAEGVYHRSTQRADEVKTKRLNLLKRDDIVYNRMWATKAAFGVAGSDVDGCLVTNDFPIYTTNEHALPGWIGLVFQSSGFQAEAAARAVGTTERRRLHQEQFCDIPIPLPPLPVQRRIVDMVEHLDNQVDRLHAEAQAARELLRPLLVSLVENSEGVNWVPLGDVGDFVRGRRFTKRDYVPSGLGCIHYGQIHTHFGHLATASLTFLPQGLRSRLRIARPGDVVVAAASEDIAGLGKATVWMGDEDVAVHDDCFIFRHGLDPRFASFLFDSPWFHSQKRKYASGMKVSRILGDNLARIEVPVPSMETQRQVGDALSQLIAEAEALEAEEVALRRLRGSLLTLLLSGRHDIPESYAELLGVSS